MSLLVTNTPFTTFEENGRPSPAPTAGFPTSMTDPWSVVGVGEFTNRVP